MSEFYESIPGYVSHTALPKSGSRRIYSRIHVKDKTLIGVESDNVAENRTFIAMAEFFRGRGINVPQILQVSDDGTCYIQEDLGDEQLRARLDDEALLTRTLKTLVHMQQAGRDFDYSKCFATKEFGPRIIDFDLNYFKYCFLKPYGLEFDENLLQDDLDMMRSDLLKIQSGTFLYRDFQSRNVMVKNGEPYFIDFQGGFKGPFYYDLCSFVFQASAGFDESKRSRLIDAYYEEMCKYEKVERAEFDANVRLFALFRCLQTLGCYGFRGLTEQKQYFIDSIPAGLRNFKALASDRYPYLKQIAYELDPDRI